MAFTVTNQFTGQSTLDPDEIDENFDDIESKLNGGLTAENLSASAGILNTQLANKHYEMLVKLQIKNPDGTSLSGVELQDFHPLPDLATDGTYTITDCDYYITDSGTTGNFTISVASGYVTGGAFSATTTHVSAQTVASDSGNPVNGTLTIGTAAIPASANNAILRLDVSLGDSSMISAIGDSLTITLKLKRTDGLKS